jgi:hypothetical protein
MNRGPTKMGLSGIATTSIVTRGSIVREADQQYAQQFLFRWIAGSSPAMTGESAGTHRPTLKREYREVCKPSRLYPFTAPHTASITRSCAAVSR